MSSRIDEDLAEAIAGDKDVPAVAKPARAEPARTKAKPKRNLGLLLALAVMAALIGGLVLKSFNNSAVYAKTVDQLVASRDKLTGRAVRVEGMLVHGSLVKRDNPCEYRFKLAKNAVVLDVRYAQCVVPDTFRDRPEAEVGVTAEGKLLRDGTFEATQIMAKCPSKYEEKNGKKTPVGMADSPAM
ncbi:MAG: cytochrome c maturation protein CcmE [Deltaproteobacteria bacterium]|nr:cytochrome c maturation protein CcmE [Deltaproteobacteria bacterium]